MLTRKKITSMILLTAMMIIGLSVVAEEGKPDEEPVFDFRYESWRLTRPGNTVIYELNLESENMDKLVKTLVEHKLDQLTYKESYYNGDRLIEENTGKINLEERKSKIYVSNLREEGVSFEEMRVNFQGSILECQKFSFPDGRVEIYSHKIPVGGLLRKIAPDGTVVQKLTDIHYGREAEATVSEIKSEVTGVKDGESSALSVSDLMKGMKKDQSAKKSRSRQSTLVISETNQDTDSEESPGSFLEQIQRTSGASRTERFLDNTPLWIAGFDRYGAKVTYHISRTIIQDGEETKKKPVKKVIHFEKYIRPEDYEKKPKGVFSVKGEEETDKWSITMEINPYSEMEAYELPAEAVSILPGTFNCFHIVLVSREPEVTEEEKGNERIVTRTDKKKEYWISSVKGHLAVVKKIETDKKQISRTDSADDSFVLDKNEVTEITKWTLVDLQPPEKNK